MHPARLQLLDPSVYRRYASRSEAGGPDGRPEYGGFEVGWCFRVKMLEVPAQLHAGMRALYVLLIGGVHTTHSSDCRNIDLRSGREGEGMLLLFIPCLSFPSSLSPVLPPLLG
jgi:hypothetical protein